MAFTFKLENPDGTPADPPTLKSAVPNWSPGDTIPLGPGRPPLLVVGLRNASNPDHHALLVVEAAREARSSAQSAQATLFRIFDVPGIRIRVLGGDMKNEFASVVVVVLDFRTLSVVVS